MAKQIAKSWRKMPVVARKNADGAYEPGNMYVRFARTPKEARMGIEELYPDEPEIIPMTDKEKAERAALGSEEERRLFDIWTRMLWRAKHDPAAN
jgi:hypothetical protein